MTRRESRELAFILLFEKSFLETKMLEEIISDATDSRDLEISGFAKELAFGTEEKIIHIDDIIAKNSLKWKKSRMSRVSLAILRVAVFEMNFYHDSTSSIAINEAVELCKKYGGDDEAAFVNGVLGGIVRDDN